jgi:outer membrane protein OmpA-like peptidoglycan-associated protein
MVAPLLPDPLPVGSVIVVTGVSGSANGDPLLTGVVEEIDNSYDQKDAQLNTRNSVIEAVSTAQATKPEADVLGAIESTAAKLRAAGLSCAIHVYDSGLQSIGLLEFQQNLLALDLRTVIDLIPTAQTLRNTKVVFETLGAVQDPQPALDATSLEKLSAIWQGVIAARGGVMGQPDSVTAHRPAEPIPGLPPVTVVPVPKRTIDFGDLKPSCTLTSTSWAMPANALFDGDEHVLKDDAKTLLDQAIQVLRQHPEAGVEIIGHTASVGTAPSGLELSQDRADAVADYLSGEGVDRSKITARGVGDTEPSCQDWDPTTSTQIEACAATERNVTLVATGVVLCDA